jgi:hypothetical protein
VSLPRHPRSYSSYPIRLHSVDESRIFFHAESRAVCTVRLTPHPPPPSPPSHSTTARLRSRIPRQLRNRHRHLPAHQIRMLGASYRRSPLQAAVQAAVSPGTGTSPFPPFPMRNSSTPCCPIHTRSSFYATKGIERASVVPPKTSAANVLVLPAAQVLAPPSPRAIFPPCSHTNPPFQSRARVFFSYALLAFTLAAVLHAYTDLFSW